ncbi:MAG: hypothetical protein MJ252_29130, partial [archaeon]|nr:hypothetical protein [archaeon]
TKEKLNSFIDNVFGAGQYGGRESFNVFPKYSYQELYSFKDKIAKYKDRNYTIEQIKEKIYIKIDTIMNFGQIPYKLFEENHEKFEFKPPKDKKEKEKEKENIHVFLYKDLKKNIICCRFSKNNQGKQVIYCLLKDPKKKTFSFRFFDANLNDFKNMGTIELPCHIKLLEKIHISEDKSKVGYKFNPCYIFIDYNLNVFIIGHLIDNSILLHTAKGDYCKILTDSFVTTITKVEKDSFITGHENGRIIQWKIKGKGFDEVKNISDEKIHIKRQFLAHKKAVIILEYNNLLNLLISYGDDRYLYIRKFYDFELLSFIDFGNQMCLQIDWYNCFLYTLIYDENKGLNKVKIFSMNGILLKETEEGKYNTLLVDQFGNTMLGDYEENKIMIFNASMSKIKAGFYYPSFEKNSQTPKAKENSSHPTNLRLSAVPKDIQTHGKAMSGFEIIDFNSIGLPEGTSIENTEEKENKNKSNEVTLMGFKYLRNTKEFVCLLSNGAISKNKFNV